MGCNDEADDDILWSTEFDHPKGAQRIEVALVRQRSDVTRYLSIRKTVVEPKEKRIGTINIRRVEMRDFVDAILLAAEEVERDQNDWERKNRR